MKQSRKRTGEVLRGIQKVKSSSGDPKSHVDWASST